MRPIRTNAFKHILKIVAFPVNTDSLHRVRKIWISISTSPSFRFSLPYFPSYPICLVSSLRFTPHLACPFLKAPCQMKWESDCQCWWRKHRSFKTVTFCHFIEAVTKSPLNNEERHFLLMLLPLNLLLLLLQWLIRRRSLTDLKLRTSESHSPRLGHFGCLWIASLGSRLLWALIELLENFCWRRRGLDSIIQRFEALLHDVTASRRS